MQALQAQKHFPSNVPAIVTSATVGPDNAEAWSNESNYDHSGRSTKALRELLKGIHQR